MFTCVHPQGGVPRFIYLTVSLTERLSLLLKRRCGRRAQSKRTSIHFSRQPAEQIRPTDFCRLDLLRLWRQPTRKTTPRHTSVHVSINTTAETPTYNRFLSAGKSFNHSTRWLLLPTISAPRPSGWSSAPPSSRCSPGRPWLSIN